MDTFWSNYPAINSIITSVTIDDINALIVYAVYVLIIASFTFVCFKKGNQLSTIELTYSVAKQYKISWGYIIFISILWALWLLIGQLYQLHIILTASAFIPTGYLFGQAYAYGNLPSKVYRNIWFFTGWSL